MLQHARAFTIALALFVMNCNAAPAGATHPETGAGGVAVPRAFARLFVAECFSKRIAIFVAPFKPSPEPAASIDQPCGNGIAFDPENGAMAIGSGAKFGTLSIRVYDPPYSSASKPAQTFTPAGIVHPRSVAWDGSGNFWVSDDTARKIFKFDAPFSTSTVPAAVNTFATQPEALAIDTKAGLMFVGDVGGESTCATTACRIDVFAEPYTGKPRSSISLGTSAPSAIALDAQGRLYVGFDHGTFAGLIKVYAPPFANDEAATYTLDAKTPIAAIALDHEGSLFAQDYETGGVIVFDGPIEGSRPAPSVVLGCPKDETPATCKPKNWSGIAFGP